MSEVSQLIFNATFVAVEGRALAIEGPVGSGKSSLALALIDRGAQLIGDDGALLERVEDQLLVSPPSTTSGLIEIRGVGLVTLRTATAAPLALILTLGRIGERLPERLETRDILGCAIPVLPFEPGSIAPGPRAEWALRQFGLRP